MAKTTQHRGTLIIGAGIGGLAAALRLAGAGQHVEVVEQAAMPGGKLRTVPSAAGPVDAGPTVLTLLPLFQALFEAAGRRFDAYVSVEQEPLLARHWWPDGSTLDLHDDPDTSAEAVRAFAGSRSEAEFRRFCQLAKRLFQAFDGPVMQAPSMDMLGILAACARNPSLIRWLLPGRTLWQALADQFSDPRLVQLFARYATYVGGAPFHAPALLALIWQAESAGVWRVAGGMSALAAGVARAAEDLGAEFHYQTAVTRISRSRDGFEVALSDGTTRRAARVIFNGDPRALTEGMLGDEVDPAVRPSAVEPRSLSAWVWSFAARPSGRDLAHHNVFFNDEYRMEFDATAAGRMPHDAALYVCAQDRGHGPAPMGPERFEIILNGAPAQTNADDMEDFETCRTQTFRMLSERGLDFDQLPGRAALTTPSDFAALFPGSAGSLYGRSPHGMMASFKRPVVRSRIPGLYLAGGGVHPGAGLPMALTSGRRAAEAILKDLVSTSTSRRTVTRGGMSTGSRTVAPTVSRSSPS